MNSLAKLAKIYILFGLFFMFASMPKEATGQQYFTLREAERCTPQVTDQQYKIPGAHPSRSCTICGPSTITAGDTPTYTVQIDYEYNTPYKAECTSPLVCNWLWTTPNVSQTNPAIMGWLNVSNFKTSSFSGKASGTRRC